MNLAAMERELAEMTDLAAVPEMSSEERATKLAEYKAKVGQLAEEERQGFAALPDPSLDNVFTGIHVQQLRALRATAREHRAAQRSLEKLEREIAKDERRADGDPQDAIHPESMASQSGQIRRSRKRA